jgi:uncharacterized protein (TIGR03437 family)
MGIRKHLRRALLLVLAPAAAQAANYAFVFHGAQSTVSIYDADTMQLVGSPSVGPGARRAFGAPDPSNPTQFLKFYVVTGNSVVVLNPQPPFSVRATLPLSGSVPVSPNPAALSPDGQRLLVLAGDTVHVINTRDAVDTVNVSIPLPANPSAVSVTPNSRFAYVMSTESTIVRIIQLSPAVQLLTLTVPLPPGNLPIAMGMTPNGSRLYITAPGQLFEVDRVSNTPAAPIANPFSTASAIVFDPDPVVSTAVINAVGNAPIVSIPGRSVGVNPFTTAGLGISEVILPGSNRMYMLAGTPGRVFQGLLTAGGPVTEVSLPEFGANGVDIENSPDGRWIFVAFGSGRLSRFDPSGVAPASQAATQLLPSGLSLVYAASLAVSQMEIYGGNAQIATAGSLAAAPLAVRVRGPNGQPAFNQIVSFSLSSSVLIQDPSVPTNLSGVAETLVTVNVSSAVEITATVVSGAFTSSVTFTLNGPGGSPGGVDGLIKASGDRQTVVQGSQFPFPLVVRATSSGVPVPNLTISSIFPGTVSCPASALTDSRGEATFTCTAAAAAAPFAAEIQMTDAAGRMLADPFRVQVVLTSAELPTALELDSDGNIMATVREVLSGGLRFRATKADGTGAGDIGISLTAPGFDLTFDPAIPITSPSGFASASVRFGCQAGAGVIRAVTLTQSMVTLNVPFTVTPGPASQMIKRQGDNQSGNPGRLLNGPGQALLVRLADACGNGIRGQRVEWRVNPPESASLENVFSTTNDIGEASVLVRLGNRGGPFTVTATAGGFSAAFNLTVNLVASRITQVSGNNQSVVLGQAAAQPLVVETQDANGFAVAGVDVTFRVTGGSATVDPARATTNAQGRASTTVRAGNSLGTITIVAEGAGQSVTFTVLVLGRVPVAALVGFVNGASFRQGWVPGSLGTIFGTALMEGISGIVAADRAPFPTVLRGVRVIVEGVDAPLISLISRDGQDQINLQVPFGISTATGTITVIIENNGSRATITGVRVFPVLPGIFEFDSGGTRLAAALHADFSVVTPQNPARQGEIILLFVTGLGATNPQVATNVAGPTPPAVTVRQAVVGLNGEGMEVLGSFYAPGLYTAYQVNFRVGQNVRGGLATLSLIVDGIASQDSRLPIQ